MSADPTPLPARAPAPVVGEGLVEFIRTQRANASYALLGLAAAFLAATLWLATKGEKAGPAPPPAPAVDPLNPDAPPPPPPPEVDNPKKGDYRLGWIGTAIGFVITAGAGARLLAGLPKPTEAEQRTHARGLVLAVGSLLGASLIVVGAFFFLRWHESLTKWLDTRDPKEAEWVAYPLLMVITGAGLVFVAIQPARAEERDNQTLRRLVYGANLGLTVLLLAIGLAIANVVFAHKVQNTLDTTATGFYTLSEATKTTVARLPEPVTAYVILPDAGVREFDDVRQLMYLAQEASGGKLIPQFISPVTNKTELQRLQEKYPKVDKAAMGVLLTAGGEDSKRAEFIPVSELFKMDRRPNGGQQETFIGEAVIVQKLRYLADADAKPVVYFTQGSGELGLAPGGDAGFAKADREAGQLKTFLQGSNLDVRPLEIKAGGKAEVPADATVVVVADPVTPLPEAGVKALRDYMTGPRKGKMVLLAEARPGGKDRKMAKTGLEGLVAEFGVKLGDQFVYSVPIPAYNLGPKDTTVVFAVGREGGGHPLAQPFARMQFTWSVTREVAPAAAGPGAPFQVTPIMTTAPGRPTWLEDELLDNPLQTFRDMLENEALLVRKQVTRQGRPVAVAVAEGGAPPNPMNPHGGGPQTPRMVVYASGDIFSNDAPRVRNGGNPPTYELMAGTIDWLRDRAVVAPGVEAKVYTTYTFPSAETVNETRLVWLPLGLALLGIAGFGAGVWVIRRK
ncbi:MAG TPA: Gldg family protein [Urbifossiella sp.]|jgi:uncharacterized membrane protein|nr:Gldg family protein [Urbifossiella sp.]